MPRERHERILRLDVEYDGTDYCGFQIQPNGPTIQGALEAALLRLTGVPIRVHGAGRTDAGVHALGQVVSFRTDYPMPDERFAEVLNRLLPESIAVWQSGRADEGFHARFSAIGKVYEYHLLRSRHRRPIASRFAEPVHPWPDVLAMNAAMECLLGRHDFSGFTAAGGKANDRVRTIASAQWTENDEGAFLRIQADGFLYKMVRNIVGTALEIGIGRRPVSWMAEVLDSGDRSKAGPTAAARGLRLVRVLY
ncbi:MAG TPA: tRNA pseudouridine(38-40) synthase TruA [Armatimonadota bacterium]|nr:tRNA pseudouridine(38-40) synthase TruA [Armatimonadota bacterium]